MDLEESYRERNGFTLIELLVVIATYQVRNDSEPDARLRIFSCPGMGDPVPNFQPYPPGPDRYIFALNYAYPSVASRWAADPSFSPFKPEDSGSWTLMADFICKNDNQARGEYTPLAHSQRNGLPTGANHRFNDGHVQCFKWNGGTNMRTITYSVVTRITSGGAHPKRRKASTKNL